MATVAEVRDAVFPAATLARPDGAAGDADANSLGGHVAWVRVMRARVPAFDALEAGDLVIVPRDALAVVVGDDAGTAALVDALAAAPVAAVLLVGEPAPPHRFVELLADAAIPAFVLASAEAHSLERSTIGFLVNREAELDRLAGTLERRLETLALAEADLEALVGEVASALGRAVALEDRRGDPIAVHAPAADAATAGRYVGGGGTAALRVPLPASDGSSGGGSLALLGDRRPTELERLVADRAAPLLSLALARDLAVRSARDAARHGDALPSAGPPWIVVVARQADDPREARDRLRRDVRLLAPARRLVLRGDADSLELRAVIAGDPADPRAETLTARIAATLARPVARSRPFGEPTERAAAEAEARGTLETWALARGDGRFGETAGANDATGRTPLVLRAERLPAYRLLVGLHNLPDGRRQAEALLEPVTQGSRRARLERLRTLRAVLREPGGAEAAASLGVHRNTLAYRVRRIEDLTGWSLADPDLRLPLLVALELVQDDQ